MLERKGGRKRRERGNKDRKRDEEERPMKRSKPTCLSQPV